MLGIYRVGSRVVLSSLGLVQLVTYILKYQYQSSNTFRSKNVNKGYGKKFIFILKFLLVLNICEYKKEGTFVCACSCKNMVYYVCHVCLML
jgi:hypothetical protein